MTNRNFLHRDVLPYAIPHLPRYSAVKLAYTAAMRSKAQGQNRHTKILGFVGPILAPEAEELRTADPQAPHELRKIPVHQVRGIIVMPGRNRCMSCEDQTRGSKNSRF